MTKFIGTNGNDRASTVSAGFSGWTTGLFADLIDATGDTFIALGGNDKIVAGGLDDVILGGDGNDVIDGRAGNDVMDGGKGKDTMDVSWFAGGYVWNMASGITGLSASGEFAFNFENAITGDGADNIFGSSGKNVIRTNAGNDTVNAGLGNDTVYAGLGNDSLIGGGGNDTFVFNTALNAATNVDRISDFGTSTDVFYLDDAIFVGLAAGGLAAGAFKLGSAATDADDRIIFENIGGEIFFDPDGVGGLAQIKFIQLNSFISPTAVNASDFFII